MIDLKWLKSTQNLTRSPLWGEKLPFATNIGKVRILRTINRKLICTQILVHVYYQTGFYIHKVQDVKMHLVGLLNNKSILCYYCENDIDKFEKEASQTTKYPMPCLTENV